MNFMYLIILVLPFAIGIYTSYINISFNDKSLYFGVRLPLDFKTTDEMENIKKQYKKNIIVYLSIVFVISSILFFIVPDEFTITVGIIGILLYSGLGVICFAIANSKIAKIKKREKWSGYSKNIVVVDLDYRNTSNKEKTMSKKLLALPAVVTLVTFIMALYTYINTKDELIPGVFGENGIVKEYVKRGEVVSIWQYLFPVLIQALVIGSIYLSYYFIIKSKQVLNGGEVESLKVYNKKVKNATIYYTTLIATVISMFFMSFYIFERQNNLIAAIVMLVILLVSVVLYTLYYQRVIQEYKVNYDVNNGKMNINRDDDKNYIFGMFYNNPNDPALFIPKRVGTGYDFNYGNIKVRIVTAIGCVVVIVILGFAAFVLPFSMNDKIPELTNDSIKITGMYGSTIDKDDIAEIKLVKSLPSNLRRSNGADLDVKLIGNFIEDEVYKAKLYIDDAKGEVIRILKKDGSRIYINHATSESTEKLYNMLKSYITK